MKINIVSYEDVNGWILGKFARNLHTELNSLGHQCTLSRTPVPEAQINHHIIFLGYQGIKTNFDSLMITHIDSIQKMITTKKLMQSADVGICMSSETMHNLINEGIPRSKLAYVLPAHDNLFQPRKFHLGITSKVFYDGRKNEQFLLDLANKIDPSYFKFTIMGSGWESIVTEIKNKNFEINYFKDFNLDDYKQLMPTLDYYLYFGFDEGSMGFMDALASGVKTVVTPQGYHLDAVNGITHPIASSKDLIKLFLHLQDDTFKRVESVKTWNWRNYATEHLRIWNLRVNSQIEPITSLQRQGIFKWILSRIKFNHALFVGTLRNYKYEKKSIIKGLSKWIFKTLFK